METILICILAGIGAGLGTGLANKAKPMILNKATGTVLTALGVFLIIADRFL